MGQGDSVQLLPPGMAEEIRHVRSTSVVSREIAGETLVVPIRSGVGDLDFVYTFNELGAQLWSLLDAGRTPAELAQWVAENFDVSAEQALLDVAGFLSELQEAALICPSVGAGL